MAPTIPDDLRELYAFTRSEFEAEWRSDFARLRRVPSTHVLPFVDFFIEQSPEEQIMLADDMALAAMNWLTYPRYSEHTVSQVSRRFWTSQVNRFDWRYMGTDGLRLSLEAEGTDAGINLPPDVRARAAAIIPTSANAIREGVRVRFLEYFGASAEDQGKGLWRYRGLFGDTTLQIEAMYPEIGDQLRYRVTVYDPAREITLHRLSLEALVGLDVYTRWDTIEARNLDASLDLLVELVVYCAELPGRLPAGYVGEAGWA